MASKNVADHKTVNLFGKGEENIRVLYDFSKDGGATTDTYELLTADEDIVITNFWIRGITELDSAADGASIDVGIAGGDEDILVDGVVEADVAAGALVPFTVVEGTPNVVPLPIKVASSGQVRLKILGEALTSGKCEFNFTCRTFV